MPKLPLAGKRPAHRCFPALEPRGSGRLQTEPAVDGREGGERPSVRCISLRHSAQALLESVPDSLVVSACVRRGFRRRECAQGVVCARRRAKQKEQPRALELEITGR